MTITRAEAEARGLSVEVSGNGIIQITAPREVTLVDDCTAEQTWAIFPDGARCLIEECCA